MSYFVETQGFRPEDQPREETLFHNANGYIGLRGNLEEGDGSSGSGMRGCYLNGFYDLHSIHHPEKLYGFPETGERIVNIVDVQGISLRLDRTLVTSTSSRARDVRRRLDMRRGFTERSFVWTGTQGDLLELRYRRLVSFARPQVAAFQCRVKVLASSNLELSSSISGKVANFFDPTDPRVSGEAFRALKRPVFRERDGVLLVRSETRGSGLSLALRVDHRLVLQDRTETNEPATASSGSEIDKIWRLEADSDQEMLFEKIVVFGDSVRGNHSDDVLEDQGTQARALGFEGLMEEQEAFLDDFWKSVDFAIDGDSDLEEGMRFNLYGLLQSAPRTSGAGIPAKGLSGEGYEGHAFWDTEIYMLPFFLYTRPHIARRLLEYRYDLLEGARRQARILGHRRGAAYPWRTIAGRECSAYYPSGSAQYHINADIAYAVWRYWEATEDLNFLLNSGAEMLFETARIWMELGHVHQGVFHIHGVTGPDEYTCLVDDNYFTNRMAQRNLEFAAQVHELLSESNPDRLETLRKKLDLEDGEVESWSDAARRMAIPFDDASGLTPQDAGFLRNPPWDFAGTPDSHYPLLLHYHHMTLSRHQVCKQADTVLAYVLLDPPETEETVRRSFAYYEGITTHDSSLSYAAFSILAARLGDAEKAYAYFSKTAALDLTDSHGNTKDGIHAANMGGNWMAMVWGFGGFLPCGTVASFAPRLPGKWSALSFRLVYRGRHLSLTATKELVKLDLLNGDPLDIRLYGRSFRLEKRLKVSVEQASRSGDEG